MTASRLAGPPTARAVESPVMPCAVRDRVAELAEDGEASLPAFLYDLGGLRAHAAAVRRALPSHVELLYAVKANPEPAILRVLADHVDGFEVASGGEFAHTRAALPASRLALGGPGKTARDLHLALTGGVERLHVESMQELRLLAATAQRLGRRADVLLRVNLPLRLGPVALAMGGRPTPFGIDPDDLGGCLQVLVTTPRLRLRGLHTHLASGLDASAQLGVAGQVLDWAADWARRAGVALEEVNLGGGMAVDYHALDARYDWAALGEGLRQLASARPGLVLSVEPGRALTAYAGWYAARVLDVKRSHGSAFAVLHGGTHHLRTPAAKGHDQPFQVIAVSRWPHPWPRPEVLDSPVTVTGNLCTPKDVLAREVRVARLRAGDVVAFAMAGAYAWNISHHDFLMQPPPAFHYLGEDLHQAQP